MGKLFDERGETREDISQLVKVILVILPSVSDANALRGRLALQVRETTDLDLQRDVKRPDLISTLLEVFSVYEGNSKFSIYRSFGIQKSCFLRPKLRNFTYSISCWSQASLHVSCLSPI